MQRGCDLRLPQLASPEHVPDTAPSCLEKVRHRAGRGPSIHAPVGDHASREPVGANGRLAWPHPRPGAPTDIFQRADRRVLHPRFDVLRANQLALTEQGLERELLAVRLGHPELRWAVPQLIHFVVAVVQRHLRRRACGGDAEPPGDQVGDALRHQAVGGDLAADDAGEARDAVPFFVVDDGEVAAHLTALGFRAQVVKGPHAGVGAHRARRGHAVQHLRPLVDEQLHLIPFDG